MESQASLESNWVDNLFFFISFFLIQRSSLPGSKMIGVQVCLRHGRHDEGFPEVFVAVHCILSVRYAQVITPLILVNALLQLLPLLQAIGLQYALINLLINLPPIHLPRLLELSEALRIPVKVVLQRRRLLRALEGLSELHLLGALQL